MTPVTEFGSIAQVRGANGSVSRHPLRRLDSAMLLTFDCSDVCAVRSTGIDQVASGSQPEEIPQIDAAVGVTRYERRKTDKVGSAYHQSLPVDTYTIHPPAIRIRHIGTAELVALSSGKRQVVGKDVRPFVELEVRLTVVPGRIVGDRDAAGIGIVGNPMLLVAKRYRASDRVIDGNAVTSQFESIAVAGGGGSAATQESIVVRHTIFN